jgi:environmental stress-induced protein Ves
MVLTDTESFALLAAAHDIMQLVAPMFEPAPIIVRAADTPAQPWRNGGGRTRELLTRPARAREWTLRISLAEVDRDGPFSAFPGVERWFSVIDGTGVRLSLPDRLHELSPGHAPLHFSGAVPVDCSLIDGATTDLNLMYAGGEGLMQLAQSGESWRCALPGRGVFTRVAGRWQMPGLDPVRLPSRCLLWLDAAGEVPWSFTAEVSADGGPAIWLGYAP